MDSQNGQPSSTEASSFEVAGEVSDQSLSEAHATTKEQQRAPPEVVVVLSADQLKEFVWLGGTPTHLTFQSRAEMSAARKLDWVKWRAEKFGHRLDPEDVRTFLAFLSIYKSIASHIQDSNDIMAEAKALWALFEGASLENMPKKLNQRIMNIIRGEH